MRQLVQDLRSGKLDVVDVPDPRPGPDEVVVRTQASLISAGTELALVRAASRSLIGKARERPDAVRKVLEKAREEGVSAALAGVRARLDDLVLHGYSSSGVVEEIGADVEGLRVGDRVACIGANVAYHAERITVRPALCVPLPDGLSFAEGAFGAVGAIAAWGVRLAGVEAGSVVVVVGLGLIGQISAQLATAAGARVIGVDVAADKIDAAMRHGLLGGGEPGAQNVSQLVAALSDGHGADAVLITAATRDAGPLDAAAELARDRGTVCVVGDVPLVGTRNLFYSKELQLRVSRSYGPGRYDPAYEEEGHDYPLPYVRWTERRLVRFVLEEAAAKRIRLDALITHEFPIDQAVEAYEALSAPGRMGVLLRYAEEPRAPAVRVELSHVEEHTDRLRIGLIGPGVFARATLLPLFERESVQIAAVAGTTPARAFGVAKRRGSQYATTSAGELLADPAIDTAVIATRHDSHADLAIRALEAGKSVFLEKPLAIREDELERLRAALGAGSRLVVDFNRDFAPATSVVAAHFAERRDPLSIHYRVNAGFVDADSWVRDEAAGGGRLVGEACHFVALCSALVTRPLETVTAVPLGRGPRTLEGDSFTLTLGYEDGSVATIAYVSSGAPSMSKERVEVIGAGRSAVIDDFRRVELDGRTKRGRNRRDKGHAETVARAIRFFREGGAPPVPYERLLETTLATLVARDALTAGDATPRPLRSG